MPPGPRPAAFKNVRPRDALAVLASRVSARASRATGRNGSAIPGYVAGLLAPGLASRLATDLESVCLVSGTNGKTSTTHFLAGIIAGAGRHVIANRSGANLQQAVTSTLVAEARLDGRLAVRNATAVLEVDEAALPLVARSMRPSVVVLTNLYRDQLDRFGETDRVLAVWAEMIARLPPETVIVWCADDPRLRALVGDRPGSVSYGLASAGPDVVDAAVASDVHSCPSCRAPLAYRWTSIAHLGSYACLVCGFARRDPWLSVDAIERTLVGQTLRLRWGAFEQRVPVGDAAVEVQLPSLGNAYNAAAAVAAATVLGVAPADAAAALAKLAVPFARFEELDLAGRRVVLSLVKNPVSLGELVHLVGTSTVAAVSTILFLLSDNHQDGRDVSWYWDVDPSPMLVDRSFVIGGRPGRDFEVRLKYLLAPASNAPIPGYLGHAATAGAGLRQALAATPPGATCIVAATYTAMIALRAELASQSLIAGIPL